jgi:hypothetical protein
MVPLVPSSGKSCVTTEFMLLSLRLPDPPTHFKSVLDQLAEDPTRDPIRLLFPQDAS